MSDKPERDDFISDGCTKLFLTLWCAVIFTWIMLTIHDRIEALDARVTILENRR